MLIILDTEYNWEYSNGNVFDLRNYIVSVVALAVCGNRRRLYRYHFYDSSISNCDLDDLRNLFQHKKATIVGHNLKVDIHQLDKLGVKHGEKYYDTMFAAFVASEAQQKPLSLKYLSGQKQRLGDLLVHEKKVQPSWIQPWWLLYYNEQDVWATYRLAKKQFKWFRWVKQQINKKLLPPNAYWAPTKLMNDLLPVIIEMERNGFCLDREELERVRESAYEDRRIIVRNIRKILRRFWGIKYFKVNSSQQRSHFIYGARIKKDKASRWAKYFAGHNPFEVGAADKLHQQFEQCFEQLPGLGLDPVLGSIRKASLSTDRDTLKELLHHNPGSRILKLFYEESRLRTLIETFIDGTISKAFQRDGRWWLNTSYNQTVARTGRLSSSNPNLHNWPREGTFPVRRCIVSRFDNGKIADADSSQLELRFGMWYYGDKQGRLDYEQGINIHSAIAEKAYGRDFTDAQRSNTKATVFRVWYRGTARSIVRDQKIPIWSLDEAQTVVDEVLGRYEGVAAGQERDLHNVKRFGYLDTPSGRRYRFDLSKFNLKNKVANYPIQGGATADFVPCCMIVAYREFKNRKLNSLLIGQVHDSILADVYPGEEDVVQEIFKYALEEGGREEFNQRFNLNFDFPLGSGCKIDKHW